MSRVATMVPSDSDLLCEGCGYTLNGLPIASNCPECGRAIESSVGTNRTPPVWEVRPSLRTWLSTPFHVIFRPTHFYQTTTVRGDVPRAQNFAWIHWGLSALLFTAAAWTHTMIFWEAGTRTAFFNLLVSGYGSAVLLTLVFVALVITTQVAARLTAWEAAYRGLRLPIGVVLRGLFYHAAHYLPVALLTLCTVLAYRLLKTLGVLTLATAEVYLYLLCGEVILFAAYLFHTYWIGMRNMMYANR